MAKKRFNWDFMEIYNTIRAAVARFPKTTKPNIELRKPSNWFWYYAAAVNKACCKGKIRKLCFNLHNSKTNTTVFTRLMERTKHISLYYIKHLHNSFAELLLSLVFTFSFNKITFFKVEKVFCLLKNNIFFVLVYELLCKMRKKTSS